MNNKNIFSFAALSIFILTIIFTTQICYAGTPDGTSQGGTSGDPIKLTNPLTGDKNSDGIPVFLGKVINYVMGIIGSLALVMFIYGGLTWMLSGGSQEQVSKGKNIVIWATLGLAIIFISYALVKFVIEAFK